MKKNIIWTIMVSTIVLSSCSIMEDNSNKSPEEILKKTQSNFIENIQSNVFSNNKVDFDGSLDVDVESPFGGWNWTISYNGKWSQQEAEVDLNVNWEFDIQGQSWNVDLSSTFLVTLDRIYMNISKLDAQLPDPSLQAYLAMSQMIINKWFYVDNQATSQQLSNSLKNIDLKKQFKENNIFKIDSVIEDKKYNVSLHKDNVSSIIYDISKDVDPNFTWTKQEIFDNMSSMDITWVLTIEGDSYFSLSWSISDWIQNVPFEFRYLSDKTYIKTQGIVFDINKSWSNFDGIVSMNQAWISVNVSWKLDKETFELNLSYNQAPIKANANLIYNAEKIDNIELQIPENATNLQELIQQAMWWAIPQQNNVMPTTWGIMQEEPSMWE